MNVRQVLVLIHSGASDREIVRLAGCNRRTVARYRAWARTQGLLEGELPEAAVLEARLRETLPERPPPQQCSSVATYTQEVQAYLDIGLEIAAIQRRLEEKHGVVLSYDALWRLARRLEVRTPEAFVRVEVAPGSEAQVDFGYAGHVPDPVTGKARKSWVFVMLLSFSRYMYAEIVLDQKIATWLRCHVRAFAFFSGVVGRVVLDNLRSAVVHASIHDPVIGRAYQELAEHYGFRIDPNPPATPRLKGKVEKGGVHYVKRNFLAGREPETLAVRNARLLEWCRQIAGLRDHGTTRRRPREQFEQHELPALSALPSEPYDMAIWKQALLHRDCHLTFDASYYSAPFRLVGQRLYVRGGISTVRIYTADHLLVATHDRATEPGQRKTNPDHLPPEKVPGLVTNRDNCRAMADAVGSATRQVVDALLENRPVDKLREVVRLLKLDAIHGADRLEAACRRALAFGDPRYLTVRRILEQHIEADSLPAPLVAPAAAPAEPPASRPVYQFVRHVGEFAARLVGMHP